jgi:flavin-dependent dehydrogenase
MLALPMDDDLEASMNLAPTLTLEQAAGRVWPVVVVGAGPAGAVAAGLIARAGSRVLLVDRSNFPRAKVCGCCLNGRALSALAGAGLADLPARLGAVPLTAFRLAAGGREAELPLDRGVSLSREAFDAELIRHAIECGADFLPATRAVHAASPNEETRSLLLSRQGDEREIAACIVVAADGLAGSLLAEGSPSRSRPGSRIGAGVVVDFVHPFFAPGTIYMATAKAGYVGLVRLESGALDIACALDPGAVRASGGPGAVVEGILADVAWPIPPHLADEGWRGTAPLTRQARRVSGHRLFGLGDATGYVEPFTGEGMAWAMSSAVALAPIARAAALGWRPEWSSRWRQTHRRIVTRRQRVCRVAAEVLRRPWLAALAVYFLARLPVLGRPVISHLNSPAMPALHAGGIR